MLRLDLILPVNRVFYSRVRIFHRVPITAKCKGVYYYKAQMFLEAETYPQRAGRLFFSGHCPISW